MKTAHPNGTKLIPCAYRVDNYPLLVLYCIIMVLYFRKVYFLHSEWFPWCQSVRAAAG